MTSLGYYQWHLRIHRFHQNRESDLIYLESSADVGIVTVMIPMHQGHDSTEFTQKGDIMQKVRNT